MYLYAQTLKIFTQTRKGTKGPLSPFGMHACIDRAQALRPGGSCFTIRMRKMFTKISSVPQVRPKFTL